MAATAETFVRWGRSGREIHWGKPGAAFAACNRQLSTRSALHKAYGATAVTCENCKTAIAKKGA